MFSHEDIWRLIDRLAEREGISLSELARRSGLSTSVFNRAKRVHRDGSLRWPSTESISQVLTATRTPIADLPALMARSPVVPSRLPSLPMESLSSAHFNEKGRPHGSEWRARPFTFRGDTYAFMLQVTDASLEPTFSAGDSLIVCKRPRPEIGDRMVVRLRDGSFALGLLVERPPQKLVLESFSASATRRTIAFRDTRWLYRIRWRQY